MKKILLFAAAAVIAVSANAQLVKKQAAGKPMAQQQVSQKATMAKKFEIAGAKAGAVAVENKLDRKAKMSLNVKDVKPVNQQFKAVRRAAEVQPTYEGYGISRSSGNSETWTMNATTVTLKDESTAVALQDIIPNPFGFEHTYALYTAQNGSVVVEPTLIASFTQEGTTYYLFLESATSNDGKITFPLDDAGHITGSYDIIYSIYPNETYNFDEWLATYDGYSNVKYNLPGEDVEPAEGLARDALHLRDVARLVHGQLQDPVSHFVDGAASVLGRVACMGCAAFQFYLIMAYAFAFQNPCAGSPGRFQYQAVFAVGTQFLEPG